MVFDSTCKSHYERTHEVLPLLTKEALARSLQFWQSFAELSQPQATRASRETRIDEWLCHEQMSIDVFRE
jgi:hypothetical protein